MTRPQLTEEQRRIIKETVDNAPPLTEQQKQLIRRTFQQARRQQQDAA